MAGKPPSRRIADELRAAILRGELAPGARLPSERELARIYGTARNTAREAVALLQADGLVDAQHGRGVFVRRRPPLRRLAHDRYARAHRAAGKAPFRMEAESQGREARVEVLSIGPETAPAWVADRLSISAGDQVLLRRNRYLADGEAVQLANTYIPWHIAEATPLLTETPGPGGIYACLESLGHELGRLHEDVSARMPVPEEVALLGMGRGIPVIDVIHTSWDTREAPIEVTNSILPADRNILSFELPVR
jgi:GntR family transcriptional regulator